MNKLPIRSKDCAIIRNRLSSFEDGEVSPEWRAKIEAHLAACPDCRQALADLRRLWLVLEDAMPPQPRPEFAQEVMRKITKEFLPGVFNWRRALASMFPAPATMAAMVVFGLLMGGWMGRTLLEEFTTPLTTVATSQAQAATLDALDVFAPTPRGSLAQGYFVLVSEATQVK